MHRTIAFVIGAAACCALVTGCGGGDSSPSPTPTPTPTTSPTPTPTPTPTSVDFDFTKAFTAVSTNTAYSFAYFFSPGQSEVWSDGSRRNGQSTITYALSPESAELEWPDTLTLTSFGAADLETATPTLRSYRNGSDALAMELPFEHVLRVSYETEQPFVRETVSGTLRSLRYALFYNSVTTSSAITSDLSYSGTAQVAGGKSGATPPGIFFSPATTLTVTASDKKITGSIRIVQIAGGTPTARAVLPISAEVGSNGTFSGDIDDTANGFKGSFVGTLAGPNREEVFLVFNVAHRDEREFIGSLIGG